MYERLTYRSIADLTSTDTAAVATSSDTATLCDCLGEQGATDNIVTTRKAWCCCCCCCCVHCSVTRRTSTHHVRLAAVFGGRCVGPRVYQYLSVDCWYIDVIDAIVVLEARWNIARLICALLCLTISKTKGKEEYLYGAFLHQGTHNALRHGSHSFTCKQHHACLSFVSVHQVAPPQQLRQQTSNCSLLLIYRPQKDPIAAYFSFIDPERMKGWVGLVGWPVADGFHLSGHPSATGRAQDSESTPPKDRRSTAGPRNQSVLSECCCTWAVWILLQASQISLEPGGSLAVLLLFSVFSCTW